MILIIYEMIMIPFRLSFETEDNSFSILKSIDPFVDFMFMTDIFFNFNTGIFFKGEPCFKRSIITKEYLKLWFWLDLFSSFPYDLVFNAIFGDSSSVNSISTGAKLVRLVKFFRFIKVLRLLRVAKLKVLIEKLIEFLEFSNTFLGFLGFFKLSLTVIFIAHWIACLWHMVRIIKKKKLKSQLYFYCIFIYTPNIFFIIRFI
jgi:hypothetical protein